MRKTNRNNFEDVTDEVDYKLLPLKGEYAELIMQPVGKTRPNTLARKISNVKVL